MCDLLVFLWCGHRGTVFPTCLPPPGACVLFTLYALDVDDAPGGLLNVAMLTALVHSLSSEGDQVCLLLVWPICLSCGHGYPTCAGSELTMLVQVHSCLS